MSSNTDTATSEYFNAQLLTQGTEQEQYEQKLNWMTGQGSSIYIKWVPDELLPRSGSGSRDSPLYQIFGQFGQVDRIEFVPKFNAVRKQTGHMAFVHYIQFDLNKSTFAYDIITAHPSPCELTWPCRTRYGMRDYKLKCCINTNAIRKVEYNASQLTDMFERLNTRVMEQMQAMQTTITQLQAENAKLRAEHADLEKMQAMQTTITQLLTENVKRRAEHADLEMRLSDVEGRM